MFVSIMRLTTEGAGKNRFLEAELKPHLPREDDILAVRRGECIYADLDSQAGYR